MSSNAGVCSIAITNPTENRNRFAREFGMSVRMNSTRPECLVDQAGESNRSKKDLFFGREARDEKEAIYAKLARTIEADIIPRLLLAHQTKPIELPQNVCEPILPFQDETEITKFAAASYASDPTIAQGLLAKARAQGVSLERIILDLLAPAATYLGELWKTDYCSFTEVTIGLSRLQQMLRELCPDFEKEGQIGQPGQRALLMPAPGENHTFGLYVVEAFFRRDGWDVMGGAASCEDEILDIVQNQWFAIAGFSLSNERLVERLFDIIQRIRHESCNPNIGILVGGSLFKKKPDLVLHIGADAGAIDGAEAAMYARDFLSHTNHAANLY